MSKWKQLNSSVQRTAQLVLGLSIVTNIAMLALPLYSLQIFDRVLTSSSIETLWMLLVGVAIIGIAGMCFEHLRRNAMTELSYYLDEVIFPVIVEKINKPTFKSNKNEIIEEYNFSQKQIQSGSALIFFDAILMPLFIFISWLIHPLLGLFTVAINVLLIAMSWIKYKWQLPVQSDSHKDRSNQQLLMLSNLSALKWLNMTYNHENWLKNKKRQWQVHTTTSRRQGILVSVIANLNQVVRWLAQAGLPTLGAILLLSNEITTGAFIAGLIIGGKAYMPVEALISNLEAIKKIKHFFHRIKPILDIDNNDQPGFQAELNGHVSMNKISLTEDSDNSANTFSLIAKPGETVAIVGSSGAGQDVIIRRLMSSEEATNGIVTIDDVRLEDWDSSVLAKSIGFISGSIQLPETEIMSLITSFGKVSKTTAIAAAERTGLNKKLIQLSLSYDDMFKLDIENPSQHQNLKQLIAVTSAVALDPQIYVMENPEGHLDMESMTLLRKLIIDEKAANKTIVLTTQSRTLLQQAENMILLNQGKTIFNGKPTEFETINNSVQQHNNVGDIQRSEAANHASLNQYAGI